jgi:HEAT repeat protein
MLRTSSLALALAAVLLAPAALAETDAVAPAGGGLPALRVHVDLARAAVDADGTSVPIDPRALARATPQSSSRSPQANVTVEAVPIGGSKSVVHVKVAPPEVEGLAWEALLAGGRKEPMFAGLTGYLSGDPGERTGRALRIVPNGETSFVLVGDVREDVRICGQDVTLLDQQALYPSLELRPATAQRLTAEQRESAQPVVATDVGQGAAPALARLLVARGSSVPGSRGAELTDGDAATVWTEQRPRMGQGEFVVMAAPKDVPIARLQIVVAPPAPGKDGAAPKTFYLVTGAETFEVTLPGDGWLKPGEAYEVVLPHPVQTSCLSLVLSDAYTRGLAHPDVSIAELVAYSEFDAPGATLEDVAKKLSSERGIAAAQVLERAGARALAAAEKAYGGLDARGRALAVDVAASHEQCVEAAPLLVRGLCEASGEAPRKAREKLERCKGAATVLATTMRGDPAARACVAPTLAAIAGAEALEPIADALAATGDSEQATRATLREAFAEALKSAPPGRLGAIMRDAHRGAVSRLEMMRAAGARVTESPLEADGALAEALGGSPPMRVRYLALGPLGELAHAGDPRAAARIAEAIARDPEWPVRARAAELGAGLPEVQSALVGAARDPEPRVREAALQALSAEPPPAAFDAARAVLASDGWSFVKAQAIGVLAKAPPNVDVDGALRGALEDTSTRVRLAALLAAGLRHASGLHDAVRERLDDVTEDAEVRAAAARTLGAVCDASAVDRLTSLARGVGVPGTSEDEQQICLGALVGLAALHPPDLRDRLSPLLSPKAPPAVRAAAQQALAARAVCH